MLFCLKFLNLETFLFIFKKKTFKNPKKFKKFKKIKKKLSFFFPKNFHLNLIFIHLNAVFFVTAFFIPLPHLA